MLKTFEAVQQQQNIFKYTKSMHLLETRNSLDNRARQKAPMHPCSHSLLNWMVFCSIRHSQVFSDNILKVCPWSPDHVENLSWETNGFVQLFLFSVLAQHPVWVWPHLISMQDKLYQSSAILHPKLLLLNQNTECTKTKQKLNVTINAFQVYILLIWAVLHPFIERNNKTKKPNSNTQNPQTLWSIYISDSYKDLKILVLLLLARSSSSDLAAACLDTYKKST